jgi:protein translocase, SecG subunit
LLLTAERRAKRKGLSNPGSPIQYQRQHRFASKPSFEHIGRPEMNILINVVLAVDMLVALLMTFVILMQRPKSEGLGAAFGGGVTENIFGAQTTNVLVKFTGWLAGIFFVLTFALGVLYAQHSSSDSALHKELMGMPTPRQRRLLRQGRFRVRPRQLLRQAQRPVPLRIFLRLRPQNLRM